MLMTAPSYIVDNCNFFKNGVERIDDSVLEKLKGCGHIEDDEKAVVFDSQGQIEAVRALLPRSRSVRLLVRKCATSQRNQQVKRYNSM